MSFSLSELSNSLSLYNLLFFLLTCISAITPCHLFKLFYVSSATCARPVSFFTYVKVLLTFYQCRGNLGAFSTPPPGEFGECHSATVTKDRKRNDEFSWICLDCEMAQQPRIHFYTEIHLGGWKPETNYEVLDAVTTEELSSKFNARECWTVDTSTELCFCENIDVGSQNGCCQTRSTCISLAKRYQLNFKDDLMFLVWIAQLYVGS